MVFTLKKITSRVAVSYCFVANKNDHLPDPLKLTKCLQILFVYDFSILYCTIREPNSQRFSPEKFVLTASRPLGIHHSIPRIRSLLKRNFFQGENCFAPPGMNFGGIFSFSIADGLAPFLGRKRKNNPKGASAAMRGSVLLWYTAVLM